MQLTESELKQCSELPGVLRALADHYHAVKETEADASDMLDSAEFHRCRFEELHAEADRIEREWEAA